MESIHRCSAQPSLCRHQPECPCLAPDPHLHKCRSRLWHTHPGLGGFHLGYVRTHCTNYQMAEMMTGKIYITESSEPFFVFNLPLDFQLIFFLCNWYLYPRGRSSRHVFSLYSASKKMSDLQCIPLRQCCVPNYVAFTIK